MIPLSQIVKRDNAYLLVVTCSIILGAVTRRIRNAATKKVSGAAIGFSVVLAFCGNEVLYSIISITFGVVMITLQKHSVMPKMVFVFSFSFRILFCLLSYYGIWRDENNLANGIQLVLTIKLISLAYEVADFRKRKSASSHMNGHSNGVSNEVQRADNHKTMPLLEEPSFLDMVCYMYCFLGIGTGPFFRFRTYYDMVKMPPHVSKSLPAIEIIISRLPVLVILIAICLLGGRYFNADEMRSLDFYTERSVLYRFFYVIPIGVIGMARYGVVWFLSEFGYIMAGLGLYPEGKNAEPGRGPTTFTEDDVIWQVKESSKPLKYDLETIRNVYIGRGFSAETYAKTFRWWNCTVQWWLAHFVYASKLLSGKPAFIKWFSVAAVSAVWHGFRAGYYFSFVGMVYIVFSEHLVLTRIGERLDGNARTIFDVIHYILFKAVGIGSFMTTFVLSSYDDVMLYLSSVYYGIYTIAAVSCIAGIIAQILFPLTPKSVARSSKTD